ncbi:hypothetical protein Nepgr_007665 [Nepenthes gracilis]|uniref:Uncharacterized protein n=1 Tax=Nepenthes gracilis TaxID=150966 RepID=A0AAD3S7E9_NEPGR|nr:hypothetical protein Nepgr_007665 [Nepenthes gracilis]
MCLPDVNHLVLSAAVSCVKIGSDFDVWNSNVLGLDVEISAGKIVMWGYYEWKQAGGIGVWRYGGTVKITPFHKEESSSPSICSENAYESPDDYESLQYEQLSEFLYLSITVADEESKAAKALSLPFDRFGLYILQAYLTERNGIADFPLNAMVIDTVIRKVVKDFSSLLVSQGIQLGLILKNILENMSLSKEDFLEAISQYLSQQTPSACGDSLEFCFGGGKRETIPPLLWDLGLKIAIGAARGFAFLHTALEYVSTGHLYVKIDMYSFSVVLVESWGNEWSFDKCRRQWDPGKY